MQVALKCLLQQQVGHIHLSREFPFPVLLAPKKGRLRPQLGLWGLNAFGFRGVPMVQRLCYSRSSCLALPEKQTNN